MSAVTNDFLSHYGVKGMKWGKREDDEPIGDSGGAKKASSKGRFGGSGPQAVSYRTPGLTYSGKTNGLGEEISDEEAQAEAKAVYAGQAEMEEISNKWEDTLFKDGQELDTSSKEYTKYLEECSKAHANAFAKAWKQTVGNSDVSTKLSWEKNGSHLIPTVTVVKEKKAIKHSEASRLFKFVPVFDEKGRIIKFVERRSLEHDFLAHYGVKGMKWGVRRSRKERRAAAKKLKEAQKGGAAKTPGFGKRQLDGRKLSNDELRKVTNRMELEQRYQRLNNPPAQQKGQSFVRKTLTNAGKQHVNKLAPIALGIGAAVVTGQANKHLDGFVDKNINVNWKGALTK